MAHLQRSIPLLASTLLTFTVACGDASEPARFADATPQQLERALQSASGGDAAMAATFGLLFSNAPSNPTSCPAIETDGNTTTLRGGCEADSGRVDGSAAIENLPGMNRVSYDGFRIVDTDGSVLELDGTVEMSADSVVSDLTLTVDGITATSRLTLTCDENTLCEPEPGAEIVVDGLGHADVDGLWSLELQGTGAVFLDGADSIIFDFSGSADAGCVAYVFEDGTGGQICQD